MRKLNYTFRKWCLLLAGVISFGSLSAQGLEGGVLLGASNYNGDLSGFLIDFSQTKPMGGLIVRYNLDDRWCLKGFLGYGRIAGADSLSTYNKYNNSRNLSFYTDIFELSGHVEYNLIRMNNRLYAKWPFIPYVFAGLGVYTFNPKANYAGQTYELQPLATEGQGSTTYNDHDKYALTQISVPFGFGIKKRIARRWTIGMEIGIRYTFTNYLDDVGGIYVNNGVVANSSGEVAAALADRTREKAGFPTFQEGQNRSNKQIKINDVYIFSGLSVTFRLKGKAVCPRIY